MKKAMVEKFGVGMALAIVALIILGNLAFWGFIVWAIYRVVMHFTS